MLFYHHRPPSLLPFLVHATAFIAVGALSAAALAAQGFNWQYSAREPTNYPTLFLGASGSFSFAQHFSALQNIELRDDGSTCACGVYQRGTGTMTDAGLYAEKWLESGDVALTAGIRYEIRQARFSYVKNNGPWIGAPGRPPQDLITQWSLDSDVRSVVAEFGGKYKFFPLHLFASASLQAGYALVQRSSQQEIKVSPAEHPFQPVSVQGNFPALNRFMLGGKLAVGWDVPLARGLYASPSVFVAAPATSAAQQINSSSTNSSANVWRWLQYGLQVSIVYGWLPPREDE
jgi:hypothetical protein